MNGSEHPVGGEMEEFPDFAFHLRGTHVKEFVAKLRPGFHRKYRSKTRTSCARFLMEEVGGKSLGQRMTRLPSPKIGLVVGEDADNGQKLQWKTRIFPTSKMLFHTS